MSDERVDLATLRSILEGPGGIDAGVDFARHLLESAEREAKVSATGRQARRASPRNSIRVDLDNEYAIQEGITVLAKRAVEIAERAHEETKQLRELLDEATSLLDDLAQAITEDDAGAMAEATASARKWLEEHRDGATDERPAEAR